MSKIKGLIFDLDGTLIDNHDEYKMYMMSSVGRDINFNFGLEHANALWYSIKGDSRDHVIRSWGLDPDEFWSVFNTYEDISKKLKGTYLHKDTAFLREIPFPKAIVTHTTYGHTDELLKLVGMRDLFNPIVSCTEDTGFKPSPLPLIYCVMDLKLDFDEVVYVGDTSSDILAAKHAGIKSVYINRYDRPILVKPDIEIKPYGIP